jgi:hypothetical protein
VSLGIVAWLTLKLRATLRWYLDNAPRRDLLDVIDRDLLPYPLARQSYCGMLHPYARASAGEIGR